MYRLDIVLLCILIIYNNSFCYGGIFKWMFKGYDENKLREEEPPVMESKSYHKDIYTDTSVLSVKVPFEWKAIDEKFIYEISEYTSKLSDLDICHHQVILHLQKSCSDLTEEELSKVAVNLLNCQSAVEKRRIYPCSNEMSLSECTSEMDQDTWNAYHIISNRVRAVCYHFRQQQFTAKTEMTVNKLVHSTEEQIDAMKLLETSQSNLKEVTSETLESLRSGHKILEKQQEELSSAQVGIRSFVSSNIRDLTREKRLIASGQKELAQITLAIKKKLEQAQKQLQDQGDGQRNTHQKILQDLSDIQNSASRVWEQLDESTKAILHKHEQTIAHYSLLMKDLQKMNSTVHHLMDILLKMKIKIEEEFSWMSSLLGDTDVTVQKIYSFVLHICYCLLGMIAASFLQVPYATKMALIIIVPLNALAEFHNNSSLTFSTLTVVLASCMFFNLSTVGAVRIYTWRKKMQEQSEKAVCGPESHVLPGEKLAFFGRKQFEDSNAEENQCESQTDVQSSKYENKSFDYSPRPYALISDDDDDDDDEKESNLSYRPKPANNSFYKSPLSTIVEEKLKRFTSNGTTTRETIVSDSNYTSKSFSYQYPVTPVSSVRRRLIPDANASDTTKEHSMSLTEPIISSSSSSPVAKYSNENTPLKSLSQSFTTKKTCIAICKSGLPCRNLAHSGSSFCHKHVSGPSRESTPLR